MFRKDVNFSISLAVLLFLFAPLMMSAQLFREHAVVSQVGGASLVIADVNEDGYGDLLLANGGVAVALGDGNGGFALVHTYSSDVSYIAAADLNGDGHVDVVASGTTVRVLLGNGDGTFQAPVEIDPGTFGEVVLSDVNGDGKLDAVATNGGTIGVWLGNGDGTFGMGQYFSPVGGAAQIALGDVNGDGMADLLVINSAGAGVLLSNGDGTFQPVQNYGTGGQEPIAIAEAGNEDGKPYLFVLNECSSTGNCDTGILGVLAGNGDGTFQPAVSSSTLATQPHAMAVTGAYGVLVAECTVHVLRCGPRMPGRVGILNTGVVIGTGGLDANQIAIGNIKGYGNPDLVVGLGGGAVSVHLAADRVPVKQTIVSSPNPSVSGQTVTFTATLTAAAGGGGGSVPSGYVRFMNGRHCLGRATVSGGVATFTTTSLPAGTLSITGKYVAQWPWQGTSTSITQVVNSP